MDQLYKLDGIGLGILRSRCPENPPPRGRRGGFTIIEVLTAGFVLAVGVLGMLSLVSVGHGLSRTARETGIAKNAARDKLEEIREAARTDFYRIPEVYRGANACFDVPRLIPPRDEAGGDIGRIQISEANPGDPNLLDVRVVVRWWGVGGNQRIQYQTRLSPF